MAAFAAAAGIDEPTPAEILGEDEEVVAGRRPVEEAFAAHREARRLLVVPERRAALDQLVLHATTLRIPVVEVGGGRLTAICGFDGHQGVALVVPPRRFATLEEVLALARTRGEPPLVLVLDRLEDPQNVGTLLRSAEASGVHGVLFPSRGAAPISPAAVKTSAGAVEHLLLVPLDDLPAGLVDLHTRGVRIVGADGDAPLTVREVDMRGPLAIVVGSEGRGLEARVRRRVDVMARIPMRGRVASLNASVAGSVFLFEAATQRGGQAARGGPLSAGQDGAGSSEEPQDGAGEASGIATDVAAPAASAPAARRTVRRRTGREPAADEARASTPGTAQPSEVATPAEPAVDEPKPSQEAAKAADDGTVAEDQPRTRARRPRDAAPSASKGRARATSAGRRRSAAVEPSAPADDAVSASPEPAAEPAAEVAAPAAPVKAPRRRSSKGSAASPEPEPEVPAAEPAPPPSPPRRRSRKAPPKPPGTEVSDAPAAPQDDDDLLPA
jgi:23S rRNA (guanosine2251-2'-O)-methyltransferase